MKNLLPILCLLIACLSADARRVRPTLQTSCPCDSSQVVDWGDGTYRSVIELSGSGYAPDTIIRIQFGPWTFDCLTYSDGTFWEIWTDVPAGSYLVTASQPQNKVRFTVLAQTVVEVL